MIEKAITLVGMSGVGKTHWSWALEKQGWHHYNVDYLIGTKYLKDELKDKVGAAVKLDDLTPLSKYIGQVGNPAKGALPLEEFRRRQKCYIDAEQQALYDMREAVQKYGHKVVNDSTGSLCEVGDEELYAQLGEDSLFVYLKASEEEGEALVERAVSDPKPLYFPPAKFDSWLWKYLEDRKLTTVEEIEPDDFSRWVFPRLFKSRLPKYERLGDMYGVTIYTKDVADLKTTQEFLEVVENAAKDR